jgi:hypothetical protein
MSSKKHPKNLEIKYECRNYAKQELEEMLRRREERKRKNWTLNPNR